jgi:hypothetical protein
MANRYWVGGSGTWNSSSTTNWSTSSGGSGGASVPTSSDDVIINSASGTGTITVYLTVFAKSINFTGYTGTFKASGDIYIYGNITLSSGMTFQNSTGTIWIYNDSIITSNGKSFFGIWIEGPGITVTLADALIADTVSLIQGTFTTANFSVTTNHFYSLFTNTKTLNLGSSTWSVWDWYISDSTVTLNAGTSTINLSYVDSPKYFTGGGKTYYNLVFDAGGAAGYWIQLVEDSNTFNTISNTSQPITIEFQAGTTQTVTNFNLNGTVGDLVIIRSDTIGSQAFLSKSSGVVNSQYLSIQDINATGGATWNAKYSTDGGNNTGWKFGDAYIFSINENFNLGDSSTQVSTFLQSKTEAFTVGNINSNNALFFINLNESFTAEELKSQVYGYSVSVSENFIFTDVFIIAAQFAQSVSENSGLADSLITYSAFSQSLTEGATLGDTSTQALAIFQTCVENFTPVDASTIAVQFFKIVTESMLAADINSVTSWIKIIDTQTAGWGAIGDTQSPSWTTINDAQTAGWGAVGNTQSSGWTTISDAQTAGWTIVKNDQ